MGMVMEKDLVQSLKLELSKKFRLSPYERLAFHSILSIRKTESSLEILTADLDKTPIVRKSAIKTLSGYDAEKVYSIMYNNVQQDLTADVFIIIIDFIAENGTEQNVPIMKEYKVNGMQVL